MGIKKSLILFANKRTQEILNEFTETQRTLGKTISTYNYLEKKLVLNPKKEFDEYLLFLINHYNKINVWRKKHTRKFK